VACDFFSVDSVWLTRYYVLFFIEIESRRVQVCGITTNPSGAWVTQQARNLAGTFEDRGRAVSHLIRYRDAKFTRLFDDVWRSIGAQVVRTPVMAPNANAFAERWVGTVRRECLDHLLIVGPHHLARVLDAYVEHYVRHEAPRNRVGWKDPPPSCRSRPDEAEGSLTVETHGRVGAALTTTGRVGTARRPGSGKRDGKVYERNQCSKPLKRRAGSNLVDLGRRAAHAHAVVDDSVAGM
jgi:Integrase core domain